MEYWSDGVLEAREGIKAPTKEGMETLVLEPKTETRQCPVSVV